MDSNTELVDVINNYVNEDVIVAFSGGVDSSLLLKLACMCARKTGKNVYAVTVSTRMHPKTDKEIAKRIAYETGAVFKVVEIDEMSEAEIENNPVDRCYRCKKSIFKKIINLADELGVSTIFEGTNEDDLNLYRPGIKAIKELGIISPLMMCHITKEQVRKMASTLGISVADRPSTPCLATRIPYGTNMDYELLERIGKCEEYIRSFGLINVRVRAHGNIARIEVDEESFSLLLMHKNEVISNIKNAGFSYVTLDMEGFRSGSMDI